MSLTICGWSDGYNVTDDIYIGCVTNSTSFLPVYTPNTGAYTQSFGGQNDGFLIGLDSDGLIDHTTYLGGSYDDGISAMSYEKNIDTNQDELIIIGNANSPTFPTKKDAWSSNAWYQPYPGIGPPGTPLTYPYITNLRNVNPWARYSNLNSTTELEVLGIDEIIGPEKIEQLKIYPIPSNGIFTIKSDNEKINKMKIIDITGKTVMDFQNINNFLYICDLSTLVEGVYFAEVVSNNKIFRTKLLIIH